MTERFMVVRTDTANNCVLVQDDLDKENADGLVNKMTIRGHNQWYEALAYDSARKVQFLNERNIQR